MNNVFSLKFIQNVWIYFVGVGFTSECSKCRKGTYSSSGAEICTPCKPNTYSGDGADICQPCDLTKTYSCK